MRIASAISRALTLVLTLAVAVVPAGPALAQPASALGHPLPDGNLPKGTVSVRVVAGTPSVPVTGHEVTLTVNGEPRSARTDASGRATFGGLPPGAAVQAKIADADNKEVTSDSFPVPEQGGARVMLSTKPFTGMGGGTEISAAGMPEARAMSGQPRPERADPAGTYTVRVTYNDLKLVDGKLTDPDPPKNHPVTMVAYGADDSIVVTTKPTSPDGHVTFENLDVSGATAYFVMTQLPRNNATDRLIAVPAIPDPQAGVRAVLSGDKRDATTPPIDDYTKLVPQDATVTPAGKVRVTLDGVPVDETAMVTLYDAATRKPIGVKKPQEGAPDPSQVRASADYNPNKDLPAGTFEVTITGGATDPKPMPGVEVALIDAETDTAIATATGTTGIDGKAKITLDPKTLPAKGVKAVLVLNGKQMASAPMDLSATGGTLTVIASWSARGKPEAVFDVAAKLDQVFYAETTMSRQTFRSLPFQVAPEVGAKASVYVYPRTLFSFSLHSFLEDQLLAVQGTFEITNYSWAPYAAGPEGLKIKLPKNHKGAIVAPQDQGDVSVAQYEGFHLLRPVPPGGRKFRAGFSLPVDDDGEVSWVFDLPMGSWQSGMEIRQNEGMTVELPRGVAGETRTASTGEPWFVIDNITIERGQSMVMTIKGLPAEAKWKRWVPKLFGAIVVLVILGGIVLAMIRPHVAPRPDADARRQKLLDELVALDRDGPEANPRRRAQIVDELERLWGA